MKRRVAVLVIVVLLLSSLPVGIAGTAFGPSAVSEPRASASAADPVPAAGPDVAESSASVPAAAGDEDVLYRTTTLHHLPDRPGEFAAEKAFDVPDSMIEFEIVLPERADV